ncbi:MAG: hypothetical protein ACREVN_12420 [Gammaproteobacteria bacterium]
MSYELMESMTATTLAEFRMRIRKRCEALGGTGFRFEALGDSTLK